MSLSLPSPSRISASALPGAFVALVACALVAGCDRATVPAESASGAAAVSAPASETAPRVPSIDEGKTAMTHDSNQASTAGPFAGALKQDMAYGDLRKLVLAQGFAPVSDPQCRAQVVGDEKTCAENPDLAICKACGEIPELSAYSGDGYATTRFRNAQTGQRLEVTSYGMIEDWNAGDADSRLRVTEWTFAEP